MDEIEKDARFAHIVKDPKFRRIPRAERKVKIDKRFKSMFNNKKFTVHYTVDKRGRPVNHTSTENLRKYYELSSEDESADEISEANTVTETSKKKIVEQIDKGKTKRSKKKKKGADNTGETKESEVIDENITEDKSESEDKDENEDQDEDEDSTDNCFSSNGALLRIKPATDGDSGEESESQSDLEGDADKNDKQLHIRRKNESEKLSEKVKKKLKDLTVNYARGEGILLTDSSSEEESSEASDEEDEIEHDWGELDKEAETTDEITNRLAICNMDWDRIRALDLMVLFNSFLPHGGLIHSVTIYPSDFGLQRMKEEEVNGPIELTQMKNNDDDDEEENEEGSEYHMEKLRQYQLNRLKYYYAVVEFDSSETANKIYKECDGIEYESTATKIDLRFIPDDMTFDQEPKEVCTEIPELSKYQPRQFTTTALQQVKVELTWDETNPERQEIAQKLNSGKLDEVKESDLQAYLASDTSDDESDEDKRDEKKVVENEEDAEEGTKSNPIEKYKSLLKEIEEQEEAKQRKDVELEFTWGLGTKEKTEKLVKERLKKDENLTPFEQYLEKRKAKRKAKKEERKKLKNADKDALSDSEDSALSDDDDDDDGVNETGQKTDMKKSAGGKKKSSKRNEESSDSEDERRRKAELELLLLDENDANNKRHFNMKKIEENATMSKSKQKRLSKKKGSQDEAKPDDFEVDVKDPRFTALFTSHHFNIDPADPHYRKTKGTEALISEKLKRRVNDDSIEEVKAKQPKTDKKLNVELQALVKSVKKNTRNIQRPIK